MSNPISNPFIKQEKSVFYSPNIKPMIAIEINNTLCRVCEEEAFDSVNNEVLKLISLFTARSKASFYLSAEC